MNILKALASVISMCSLHIILLSKSTPRYFYMIDEGNIPPIHCKMNLRGPKSMRKVDYLSLILIDFYVPKVKVGVTL
jgi:hypothetical protein